MRQHTIPVRPARSLRALAGLLALALLICLASGSLGSAARADDKSDELRDKYKQLEEQLAEEKDELKTIQSHRQDAQSQQQNLKRQRDLLTEQIETLVAAMDETQRKISLKQEEIELKQAEIDGRWDEFKAQMEAMQMMHDTGTVAMLFTATDLYELLTFSDVLQQMSEKQTEVLDFMKTQRAELNAQKEELDADLAQLEADKADMEAKVSELAGNIQSLDSTISAAKAQEQAQQVEIDATEKAYEEAKAEFDRYIASLTASSSNPVFVSGTFVWPTSSSRITQYYGNGHGGVDVGAAAGTPIYAAAEGTVLISGWHDHPYSYGNYVVIDHGGGMSTIYAHMSSRACSSGDYVQQGQVIGYVGNTGYSKGNHLHFEVRVNGTRTNPMNYFSA